MQRITITPPTTPSPDPLKSLPSPIPIPSPLIDREMMREAFEIESEGVEVGEMWRIENNWATTTELAYHFQDPFSFDGRYIASRDDDTLRIFDLATNQTVKLIAGAEKPTWARTSLHLFYYKNRTIYRLNLDSGRTDLIAQGDTIGYPRTISHDDDYLLATGGGYPGSGNDRPNTGELYRIENKPNGQVVQLTDDWLYASEPRASSKYDVVVFKLRQSSGSRSKGWWAMPFDGTPTQNRTQAKLLDANFSRGAHAAWLGDGEHFVMGNASPPKQIRYLGQGRWGSWQSVNAPAVPGGDVAPLGYSGRWLLADAGNEGYLNLLDLQKGTATLLTHNVSEIIDSEPGDGNQGDPNAHGSPDGTKVAFVSNYDFAQCSSTQLTGKIGSRVPVISTAGFPEQGILAVRHHLVSYQSKTATSFEGIQEGVLGTEAAIEDTWSGVVVTNFACRSYSLNQLSQQYGQSLYVAVSRLPDTPRLELVDDNRLVISPGLNHREIKGYLVEGANTSKLYTEFPAQVQLSAGNYKVTAVEWSGLSSQPSTNVTADAQITELLLLSQGEPPPDPIENPTPTMTPTLTPTQEPDPEPTTTPQPTPIEPLLQVNGPTSVGVNKAYQLEISLNDLFDSEIYGIQTNLDFDETLMEITKVTFHPKLSVVVRNAIDNETGSLQLAASQQGVPTGLSGDIVLVTIDAVAKDKSGTSNITLSEVKVSDAAAQSIRVEIQNLELTIASGPPDDPTMTPTPTQTQTPEPDPTTTPMPTIEPQPSPTPTVPPIDDPILVTVNGQIQLAGRQEGLWDNVTVTANGQTITTDANGEFSLNNIVTAGPISVMAETDDYLSASCSISTPVGQAIRLETVTLLSGDLNGDEIVDVTDAATIGINFGKSGPTITGDINLDETVDIFDLVLTSINFGETGPQAWVCQ
ncbi:MAG: hypothetical protein KDJ65_02795 [Anaerolineae bacterium]|nr:hypothetical protein [Anaerolineae bacterium]